MGARMPSKVLDWVALAGSLSALAIAVLPTYRVEFMASPVSREVFVENHSWFSPMILGYADPLPMIVGVVLVAVTVCALLGVVGRRRPVTLLLLSCLALVVMGLDFIVFGSGIFFGDAGIRGVAIGVPVGVALVIVASLLSVRNARGTSQVHRSQVRPSVPS